ncbi:hypothetical protein [Swaminathania salitolerans]|uniref:Uncharacterized protein n=1 Tax=Swaminathania salitolerans TaxID=182838 RepID=A0A511BSQ7_9PROT|nr:hypothetical protein [Swaminathania salitolerans]GBQ13439.1 hypothetical protein AA21291_1506 [Swaminathania salitolerans LMG 21291]GEL03320.1 hypothetical protein SSA02_24830 [Swaminathania salitolerans]
MKPQDNPADTLPDRLVVLHDRTLLPHLPPAGSVPVYGVIPAPGLGRIMGYPWWQNLTESLMIASVFDAGSAPALAASALRSGARWVVCDGKSPALDSLRDLAHRCDAHVLTSRPDAFSLGRPPYDPYRLERLKCFLA